MNTVLSSWNQASAEDALSNALVRALTTWPRDGVPENPEAWLMTTARRDADWAASGFGMGTGEPVWNSFQRSNSTRSDHNMRACRGSYN